jgi:hypothetical protein
MNDGILDVVFHHRLMDTLFDALVLRWKLTQSAMGHKRYYQRRWKVAQIDHPDSFPKNPLPFVGSATLQPPSLRGRP